MRSAWQVLGIEPGSSFEQIRQAYARLLKQHRPDVDPEGFRRVRDAYELLRDQAESHRSGAGQGVSAIFEPAMPARPSAPEPSSPKSPRRASRASRPSFGRRMRSALQRARRDERSERRVSQVLVAAFRRGNGHDGATLRLLLEELARPSSAVRHLLLPADAIAAADRGQAALPASLVKAHLQAGDLEALQALVDALAAAARAHDPERAQSFLEVAPYIALFAPIVAELLYDAAFRALPGGASGGLRELDELIHAGKEIRRLSNGERLRFARVLAVDVDGADSDVEFVITRLAQLRGAAPLVVTMFVTRFPEHGPRVRALKVTGRRVARGGKQRLFSIWMVLALLGFLGKFVQACSDDRSLARRSNVRPQGQQGWNWLPGGR